ncbi:DNA-J related domain-containing protein [Allohahella marinimesophila]|uniref:DnaJ-related protein N-terminal domain-containing protein n=1 Tax=Allohahella marinimesophila TaxID=1054972 RepID=A0ABP7NQ86_9GAMM
MAVNRQVRALELAIEEVLVAERGPMTEQQLIQRLSEAPYTLINAGSLRTQLGLFQVHFLIFHSLYRLRERAPRLLIHTLHIGFRNAHSDSAGWQSDTKAAGGSAMNEADCVQHMRDSAEALSRYYLDLEHLFSTSSGDVRALLDSFWKTFETGLTGPSTGSAPTLRDRQQD